jgi:hypothetical protein
MPPAPRSRAILLLLTLAGHLTGVVGLPTFAPPPDAKPTAAIDYPCRTRPCGCATSEECWAGDCCCFTLAEKVAWAEANGVEPPPHVRPLVAARAKKLAKPKSCCAPEMPTCCETKPAPSTTVRWVAGVFAKKCRGEGPAGTTATEPGLPMTAAISTPATRQRDAHPIPTSHHAEPLPQRPPSPPPKPV